MVGTASAADMAALNHCLMRDKPTPTVWNFYPSAEAATAALPEVNARECKNPGEEYRVGTWAEFESAERAHYLSPLREISATDWDYALNVLPPQAWVHRDGVERFRMAEYTTGAITQQYARWGGRYFSKPVDVTDSATFITAAECAAYTGPAPVQGES